MKTGYRVANASHAHVTGIAEIKGQKSEYRTPAFMVELVPVEEHAGSVKLAFFGAEIAAAEALFVVGNNVAATFGPQE